MAKIHVKDYEIHFYEVDSKLKCTMESIIKFIEDVGTEQSETLGGGFKYLSERDMAWVFYEYDVDVYRYPSYGEKIKVKTEPCGFNKFYALRKYTMYDINGEILVEAKAIFLLINKNKRRLMRVPEEQYHIYGIDPNIKTDIKIEKLDELNEVDYKEDLVVRYSDIDVNGHVNNVNYIKWVVNSLPLEILTNYKLKRVKVRFEKECKYGNKITVCTGIKEKSQDKILTVHKIENSDGKVSTKLIYEWTKERQ